MITEVRIQNYKALQNVTLALKPMSLLIGPNDSGKTSILEAIAALCRSVSGEASQVFPGPWTGGDLVFRGEVGQPVVLRAKIVDLQGQELSWSLTCKFQTQGRGVEIMIPHGGGSVPLQQNPIDPQIYQMLKGFQYYRWNPRMLSLPVAPQLTAWFEMRTSGFGLAFCLDSILGHDRDLFARLESRFRSIFPQFQSIVLKSGLAHLVEKRGGDGPDEALSTTATPGKGIHFRMADGRVMPAAQASDGILLVLAYLTILYSPEPPRVLLIEEPENGIHPKRLREVLTILRELIGDQQQTQVIMTTHSPYVVDFFGPDEVTLCLREEDGTISTHLLSESQTVREQMKVFTLGEIWTAEGDEALAGKDVAKGAGE